MLFHILTDKSNMKIIMYTCNFSTSCLSIQDLTTRTENHASTLRFGLYFKVCIISSACHVRIVMKEVADVAYKKGTTGIYQTWTCFCYN